MLLKNDSSGKVFLREISIDDTNNIVKWRNSNSVKKYLYSQDELKPEEHVSYYKNIVKAGKCSQFIIVVEENGTEKDVGTVFIKNLDYSNCSGEYGIFIGNETVRGKGYARIATDLILEYGFEQLKLHRIYLTVMEDNYAAIKTYDRCGFIKEGVMRDGFLRYDGYINIIMMGILKVDWINHREKTFF